MPQLIEVPGQGTVSFPDEMTDDQIVHAIKKDSLLTERDQLQGKWGADAAIGLLDVATPIVRGIARPDESLATLGRATRGLAVDLMAGNLLPSAGRPGVLPDLTNTAAGIVNAPMPSEENLTPVQQGLADAAGSVPDLAVAGAATALSGVPFPLAFGSLAGGKAALEGGTAEDVGKAFGIGVIIPEIGALGKSFGVSLTKRFIETGAIGAESTLTHKVIESIASQAAMQGFIEATKLPEYSAMDAEQRKSAIARSVASNSAFLLMELPAFKRGVPSETQKNLVVEAFKAAEALEKSVAEPVLEEAEPVAAMAKSEEAKSVAVEAPVESPTVKESLSVAEKPFEEITVTDQNVEPPSVTVDSNDSSVEVKTPEESSLVHTTETTSEIATLKEEPAKEATPTQAVNQAKDAIEGKPSQKELKAELVRRLKEAEAVAPEEYDTKNKSVTIDVPGDGTFKIENTKERLGMVLKKAKQIPTNEGGGEVKIRRTGQLTKEQARVALDEAEKLALESEVPQTVPEPELEPAAAEATIEQATLPRQIESDTPPPAEEPIALADIRQYLSAALDIPVRLGTRIQGGIRNALGFFRVKPETIRLKALNDIPTLAHEVGHYLHYILFPASGTGMKASNFGRQFDLELMALGAATSRPSYTPHQVRKEGVAEFVREWMTDRSQAFVKAPDFAAFFESQLQANYPEVWKIVSQARTDLARYINQPAVAKVASMVKMEPDDTSIPLQQRLQKFYDEWVNQLAPLDRAVNMLRGLGLPEPLARAASEWAVNYKGGWRGKAEHSLFKGQIDYEGNVIGPALHDILSGTESMSDFAYYLVAKRAIEKNSQGKLTGITTEDAREVVSTFEGQYGKRAEALRTFQRNNLLLLRDSGIINDDQVKRMESANLDYVPFFRVYEGVAGTGARPSTGAGLVDLPTGVNRFKGSDLQIINPFESILKNLYAFRDLAERNRVARSFMDAVEAVRGGGRVGETLARKVKPVTVNDEEVRTALKNAGIEEDALPEDDLGFTIWRAARNQSATDGIFTVWKDGKEQPYQVDDPELYRALKMSDTSDAAMLSNFPLLKPLRLLTRGLRAGATLSLEFIARNPFRDQITAGVLSNHGYVPFWDGFRGILSAVKHDDLYWDWVKSGGRYADFIASDRSDLQKTLEDVIKEPGALNLAKQLIDPRNVLKNLQAMSELMEQATRLSEFRRAKEGGERPEYAANASKDVTLNFSRWGFKGKVLNQLSAFFNAGVQDVDKLVRSHKENPGRTMLKAFMYISAPSLVAWWLGKDDEKIQNLAEWRKNYFWNVNVADIAKLAGVEMADTVLSFPKPFLLGQLYGTSLERGLDYAHGKDPNAVEKWLKAVWSSGPVQVDTFLPTGARPLIEGWANKSFFRGTKLEPDYLSKLPPSMRATPQTSEVAKGLAFLTSRLPPEAQLSPIKIDNTIRGLLGSLGRYGTDAMDYAIVKSGLFNVPERPAKGVMEYPLLRGFTQNPYTPNAYVDRFYSGLERAEQRIAAFKAMAPDLANDKDKSWFIRNADALKYYESHISEVRAGQQELGVLNKAVRLVQESRTMKPDEKREKLIKLTDLRDKLAEVEFRRLHTEDQKAVY